MPREPAAPLMKLYVLDGVLLLYPYGEHAIIDCWGKSQSKVGLALLEKAKAFSSLPRTSARPTRVFTHLIVFSWQVLLLQGAGTNRPT